MRNPEFLVTAFIEDRAKIKDIISNRVLYPIGIAPDIFVDKRVKTVVNIGSTLSSISISYADTDYYTI